MNPFSAPERKVTQVGYGRQMPTLQFIPSHLPTMMHGYVSNDVSMRSPVPRAGSPRSTSPRDVLSSDPLTSVSPLEAQSMSQQQQQDAWKFAMDVLGLPLPSALTIVREHEVVHDEGQEVFMKECQLMDDALFPKDDQTLMAALARSQKSRMPIAQRPPNQSVEEHLLQLREEEEEQLAKLADPNFTDASERGLVGARCSVFQAKVSSFDILTSSDESGDEREAIEATTTPAEQLTLSRQLTLAAVVIFLLLYPTLIEKCLLMMQCDDVDYGPPSPEYPPGGVRSLLFSDRSIDCATDEHSQYTSAALTAGLGYGIGIPLFVTVYISYLHRTQGQEYALTAFSFYTAGYDARTWWWEGVILTRKLALIAISVFVTDASLRLYIAMWFLSFALIGHIQAQPFTDRMLHNMETLSLSTLVITLNLSLLFEFTLTDPVLFLALAFVIILLNLGAISAILFFMGREAKAMFGELIQEYGHAIRDSLWDVISAIPGVRALVNWWKERRDKRRAARRAAAQAQRETELAEERNSTAVEVDEHGYVRGGGLRRTHSQKSMATTASDDEPSTFFGRLIHSLQGSSHKKKSKRQSSRYVSVVAGGASSHHHSDNDSDLDQSTVAGPIEVATRSVDIEEQARMVLRGRQLNSDGAATHANADGSPGTTGGPGLMQLFGTHREAEELFHSTNKLPDSANRSARRPSSAVAVTEDTELRDVLADRWEPPRDLETLWAEVVDEENATHLFDLLIEEMLHLHNVDQQQVYKLEATFQRKLAEQQRIQRLRRAKRERHQLLQRKSEAAIQQSILKKLSKYGGGPTRSRNNQDNPLKRFESHVTLLSTPSMHKNNSWLSGPLGGGDNGEQNGDAMHTTPSFSAVGRRGRRNSPEDAERARALVQRLAESGDREYFAAILAEDIPDVDSQDEGHPSRESSEAISKKAAPTTRRLSFKFSQGE